MTLADVTCNRVIQAADKEIQAHKKEVQVCQLGVKQLTEDNTRLNKQVEEKDEQLGKFWRNPFIMMTVGALVGIYVAKH